MTDLVLVGAKPARAEFARMFNRLLVALRGDGDDTGATLEVYFDALSDLSGEALDAGARALMREPGRRFFPTTAEWRAAAELAQREQRRHALPADETGVFVCLDCHDTGWLLGPGGSVLACPGDARCGRKREHQAHTYTQPCGCRAGNVNYMRKAHFGAGR